MGVIETKIFKSGNSAAVRLPRELGFEPGMLVRIEKRGSRLDIVPVVDADEQHRLAAMVERLRSDEPLGEIQDRERIEFPDRPGLV